MKTRKLFILTITILLCGLAAAGNLHNISYNLTEVNSVVEYPSGRLWVGSKYGLFEYNGYSFRRYTNPEHPTGAGACIEAILPMGDDWLCVGTHWGVMWLNIRTGQYGNPYPEVKGMGAVRSLKKIGDRLWIGTRDSGLWIYDFSTETLTPQNGLQKTQESLIHSIDTLGNAVYTASWEAFIRRNTNAKNAENITYQGKDIDSYALLCDEERKCVWVGGKEALYRYDTGSATLTEALRRDGVIIGDIVFDENGSSLVLGTENGILRFDPQAGVTEEIIHDASNRSSLHNNVIRTLYKDKDGDIWIGTNFGLALLRSTEREHLMHLSEFAAESSGNLIKTILKDSEGDYWFGGENGLIHSSSEENKLVSDCWSTSSASHHLRHNIVRDIYEDSDRNVWIATEGSIARYDRASDRLIYYDIVCGNRNSTLAYHIIEDTCNRLWIATFWGGILVVDKADLLAKPSGGRVAANDYFSDTDYGNIAYFLSLDEDGDVWAVTQNGLAHIDSQTMKMELKQVWMDATAYSKGNIWHSTGGRLYVYDETANTSEQIFNLEGGHILSISPDENGVCLTTTDGVYLADKDKVEALPVQPETYYASFWDRTSRQFIFGGNDFVLFLEADASHRAETPVISSIKGYEGDNPRYLSSFKLNTRKDVAFELATDNCSGFEDRTFWYNLDSQGWSALAPGQNVLAFAALRGGRYRLEVCLANPEIDPAARIVRWRIEVPYPWYQRWWAFLIYAAIIGGIAALIVRRLKLKQMAELKRIERERTLELARNKMDFFVNMSHELKTPLSLIIAPLSRLISESRPGTLRDSLSAIHRNAVRLDGLIHRILDFQKYEYETEDKLIRSHIELKTYLEKMVESFSAKAKESGIELSFASEVDRLWMNLDVIKMDSVMSNLISNAFKHVPKDNPQIRVELKKDGDSAHISVKDNGEGIKESDIPLVFIRFYQGSQPAATSARGSGIGLYMVKKYVELHGGTVTLRNDCGLLADVSLPLSGENITEDLEKEEIITASGKKRILLVDDNLEIVAFLADSLSDHYSCLKAYDGESALEILQKETVDLVIVDYMMPGMSGLDFVKKLRKEVKFSDLPVIMLTAKDDEQTELESIRAGIDAFFPKPFSLHKLQLRIAQIFTRGENRSRREGIEEIVSRRPEVDKTKSPDELLLEKLTSIIEENMESEQFGVAMLSELSGIESKTLYRRVKQLTGETPVNYIRKLRLRKASALLAQGSFTVSEVMYMVGYSNTSYFSKCFSEEYGITPRQALKGEKSE